MSSREAQITLLYVDKKALQSQIEEPDAKLSQVSEAGSRQSSLHDQNLSVKDEQRAEANVRISELESSDADWISDGSLRFAHLYKKHTGPSLDQWKDFVKMFIPKHHALLADFKKVQAQSQELDANQEKLESALREAQTEA